MPRLNKAILTTLTSGFGYILAEASPVPPIWGELVPAIIHVAGVLTVVWWFLGYLRESAKLHLENYKMLQDQVELSKKEDRETLTKVANQFSLEAQQSRKEHGQMIDSLLGVTRDTVKALGQVSDKIAELSRVVVELKTQIDRK